MSVSIGNIKVNKGWGYELIIADEKDYCGKILHFNKNERTSMHYHSLKHETFYVLSGEFDIEIINTRDATHQIFHMECGMKMIMPQNTPHRIISITKGEIIEFSTHDDPLDSYRIDKGSSQEKRIS